MKIKRFLLLLTFAFVLLSMTGNDLRLIRSIPSSANFFTTDNLGNVYLVKGYELIQLDSNLKVLNTFSENRYGTIGAIDASDPFQILVFYPGFAQINFLDTKLSMINSIRLRDSKIMQPLVVCNSSTGGFWVYDEQDFQLKKISRDMQVLYESGNLPQVIGRVIKPNILIEHDDQIFMNNPESGILIFDLYGTYQRSISLPKTKSIQAFAESLFVLNGDSIKEMNIKGFSMNEKQAAMEVPYDTRAARRSNKKLYLLRNEHFEIYALQE